MTTIDDVLSNVRAVVKACSDNVTITCEVIELRIGSDHYFMKLRDHTGQMDALCWSSIRHKYFELAIGDEIIVTGRTDIDKYNRVSFTISAYEKVGIGNYQYEFEKLKQECQELGWFNQKRPIPEIIRTVGIVTSIDGAVIKDLLVTLNRHQFYGKVIVHNALVQGPRCPESCIAAIQTLDQLGLDVIVIARGGGSIDDLFGFCDKRLLKVIFETKTPTISAIGHEPDHMLSDFVADYRAATPTAAGDYIASRSFNKYSSFLESMMYKLNMRIDIQQKIVDGLEKALDEAYNLNSLDYATKRVKDLTEKSISKLNSRLDELKGRLSGMNPEKLLTDNAYLYYDDVLVTGVNQLHDGILTVKMVDGTVKLQVVVEK